MLGLGLGLRPQNVGLGLEGCAGLRPQNVGLGLEGCGLGLEALALTTS